ncbi:MAG: phosphoglycerate transporter [Dehalococcoidia bacterium]|nr:phosphoglycerate transporter [Dehalococcoidia bacterium]
MLRLGWMSTARGPGSFALLRYICEKIDAGQLDARISVVISNRERGESPQTDRFFDFASARGLPLVCVSSSRFRQSVQGDEWRTRFDRHLAAQIDQYEIDVILLAGYMLIVSEYLCTRYPLLNLHPALPGGPTGTWQEVMDELALTGATRTGAMLHVVTPILDRGPTVSFFSFPLQGEPYDSLRSAGDNAALAAAIRAEELRREFPLILVTLQALAAGRITIRGLQAYDAAGASLQSGMDLSREVERYLAES